MGFDFLRMTLKLQCDDCCQFVSRFSRLGGNYSVACKVAVCKRMGCDCSSCPDRYECAWQIVFAQALSPDPDVLRRHQKPPLPFAFSLPVSGVSEADSLIELGLVVAGSGIYCVDMLLDGLVRVQAGLVLLDVVAHDYSGQGFVLQPGGIVADEIEFPIISSDWIFNAPQPEYIEDALTFLSPLITAGTVSGFEFNRFALSVVRRVTSIAYYYGDYTFDVDFKRLSKSASGAVCEKDGFCHCGLADNPYGVSGLMGQGRIEGYLAELISFLELGSYFNVGKKAAFGMGRYALTSLP